MYCYFARDCKWIPTTKVSQIHTDLLILNLVLGSITCIHNKEVSRWINQQTRQPQFNSVSADLHAHFFNKSISSSKFNINYYYISSKLKRTKDHSKTNILDWVGFAVNIGWREPDHGSCISAVVFHAMREVEIGYWQQLWLCYSCLGQCISTGPLANEFAIWAVGKDREVNQVKHLINDYWEQHFTLHKLQAFLRVDQN